mgnify:CR=1 FL=1
MIQVFQPPSDSVKNFIFLGEAGCGKSELAINFAYSLKKAGRNVHLFDLDQTKPLFRSRDQKDTILRDGIQFHYEEQYYDAPTLVSGVAEYLNNAASCCVLDVGGNDTGSRVIGGFAALVNSGRTVGYFVVNPYRPWSKSQEAMLETMQSVLTASQLASVRVICNPNYGYTTTAQAALDGVKKTVELLDGRFPIDFVSIQGSIAEEAARNSPYPIFPLRLFLQYPWTKEFK